MKLQKESSALLIVDVQEKLFPKVENATETAKRIWTVARAFQIFKRPICFTEQYPKGLGPTISYLTDLLQDTPLDPKTTFSCLGDQNVRDTILKIDAKQWVVCGIEAHVCVLQTVRDLLAAGKEVVVLNDAISSRSIFDYSTAIAEMRDLGARISSVETVIFEIVEDAKESCFKEISALVK